MPRNRKYFQHNTAVFVTSRIEEGLPLVPTHFLNEIIWGILARGKVLYQVKISHFVFMANHFHMLLVVDNPDDISNFVGYVKAEVAHAVNRLLGRRQKTIWSKGYDSPIILTSDDVLRYIDYIYENPLKANLVDSIRDYPGISSWEMFYRDENQRSCKCISRSSIPQLAFASMSINEQKSLLSDLIQDEESGENVQFILDPFAWFECFPESRRFKKERIKEKIIHSIKDIEAKHVELRKKQKRSSIGSTALRRQSMLKEYVPKKYAKRMVCISSDINLRKRFISYYRELCRFASKVYKLWKLGQFKPRMPAGIISPKVPSLVSSLAKVT